MKNFKMLLLVIAFTVAISACNTENPVKTDNGNANPSTITNSWDAGLNVGCDWYTRRTQDGSTGGYNLVIVKKNMWGTSIWCQYPGIEMCPYSAMGVIQNTGLPSQYMIDMSNYAYTQITSGNLVGNQSNLQTGYTVKWSSTSSDTITSNTDVKVWETSGTEPN